MSRRTLAVGGSGGPGSAGDTTSVAGSTEAVYSWNSVVSVAAKGDTFSPEET